MKKMKWVNTLAFAAMIIVNALANIIPIGGNTTAQVSEKYQNLFTPAPITFAVWGLIYAMMALFVLYQWGILDHGIYSENVREDVGIWFTVSCVLNIAWVFLWHFGLIAMSAVAIILLMCSLMMVITRLDGAGDKFLQKFVTRTGFSVYFGWIIAATIANISVLLTKVGWGGWGLSAAFWTSAVLLIGAAIAVCVVVFGKNRVAGIAVMWAYAGILIRHISPSYLNGAYPVVIAMAFIGEAAILTSILLPRFCKAKKYDELPEE